jgi:(R,R)-butanediol dehydrogenase / meso-butanediol dehydrogenase / diacetyl reductase
MKAAVYYGPNKVEVADVPEPEPTAGTVKVKVGFNGICGTDLHEYYAGPIFVPIEPHPLTGRALPLTIGHEFSGIITDVGAGVTDYAAGDRVAIEPIYRCGQCPPCRAGNYNICQQIGFHGLMSDGGMAEYTVVPTNMLHRLPDNVSLELGALVEPMSVAYHAATLGEVAAGDTAVIFGAGPIGIGLWFALRGKGLESVFVVEPSATRRPRSRRSAQRLSTRPKWTCRRSSPSTPMVAARMRHTTRPASRPPWPPPWPPSVRASRRSAWPSTRNR